MATYANPTNPFIKPDNCQPVPSEQQLVGLNNKDNNEVLAGSNSAQTTSVGKRNKNAPGMARLQSNHSALAALADPGSKKEKRKAASNKKDKLEPEAETNELISIGQIGDNAKSCCSGSSSGSSSSNNNTGYKLITDAKIGLTVDDNNNNEPSLKNNCARKTELIKSSVALSPPPLPTSPSSSLIETQNIALKLLDDDDRVKNNCNNEDTNDASGDAITEVRLIHADRQAASLPVGNKEPYDTQTGGLIELATEMADVKIDQMSVGDGGGANEISGLKSDKNKSCQDDAINDNAVDVTAENGDKDGDDDDDDNDGGDGGRSGDNDDDEILDDDGVDISGMNGNQDERAPMEQDSRRHQHIELIKKLRLQLRDLERYAYERGELEQVPPSILAERQSVILDMLKKKLPLNIDKDRIEKLELEELKCQVDKEISDLIDPLITKDHLLNQLKTQLTDLERYISHLHDTLGKSLDKNRRLSDCSCPLHGCASPKSTVTTFKSLNDDDKVLNGQESSSSTGILSDETLPKTSRLIRGLMAQLICSDMKIQEAMKMEKDFSKFPSQSSSSDRHSDNHNYSSSFSFPLQQQQQQHTGNNSNFNITTKAPQFHDGAVWTMHIDKVLLATHSLTNLFAIDPGANTANDNVDKQCQVDESLVDSVVRRQLVPAIRDLLSYGLIDPNSAPRTTYRSFLFDPYYLISSLTCLPGSQSSSELESSLKVDKIHAWDVIEDYFKSRIEPEFKNSSIKTLSQSFNLTPSMNGPIKVTSKQALLIAVDDIVERLARCKPNGPESHFKLFVYTALNQAKLATWIRIVFRNKSTLKKYYHNFSFTNQHEKMDKFLSIIEALSQIEFKLNIETKSVDQFVSAF